MRGQARRLAGARQGVPVIAHTAGVEHQRIVGVGRALWLGEDQLVVEDVKNYDGSWTEWGNSVGYPIER